VTLVFPFSPDESFENEISKASLRPVFHHPEGCFPTSKESAVVLSGGAFDSQGFKRVTPLCELF